MVPMDIYLFIEASSTNASAASVREKAKYSKCNDHVGFGTKLHPLVWESHGSAGELDLPVLSELALLAVRHMPFALETGSMGENIAPTCLRTSAGDCTGSLFENGL